MFLFKFKLLETFWFAEYFSDNYDVVNIQRSPTNFHDNYTPLELDKMMVSRRCYSIAFSGYMISELLRADYNVSPFTELRPLKWLYISR